MSGHRLELPPAGAAGLRQAGHLGDDATEHRADRLDKPVLVEGPPGSADLRQLECFVAEVG